MPTVLWLKQEASDSWAKIRNGKVGVGGRRLLGRIQEKSRDEQEMKVRGLEMALSTPDPGFLMSGPKFYSPPSSLSTKGLT